MKSVPNQAEAYVSPGFSEYVLVTFVPKHKSPRKRLHHGHAYELYVTFFRRIPGVRNMHHV